MSMGRWRNGVAGASEPSGSGPNAGTEAVAIFENYL
jgi:hypothetical protein